MTPSKLQPSAEGASVLTFACVDARLSAAASGEKFELLSV